MAVNYYDILGLPKAATAAEIKQAYVRLVKERHPDRFPDPREKEEAQDFLKNLTAAFNTLSTDRSRREYDLSLERPTITAPQAIAAASYLQGLKALEVRAHHEAVELLRTAVAHAPEDARYRSALGLALSKNPHWMREAIQETERATLLSPRSAAYQGQLAELFLGQNLRLRARKAAEVALQLDPYDERAQRILAETGPEEPPSAASGGLRGFLRRKP